ncbi:putative carboxypeptidase B, partial [Apostichopus japonicus]
CCARRRPGFRSKTCRLFRRRNSCERMDSPATVMFFTGKLLEMYNNGDADARRVLGMFDLHIVPSLNGDGYVFTWTDIQFVLDHDSDIPDDKRDIDSDFLEDSSVFDSYLLETSGTLIRTY